MTPQQVGIFIILGIAIVLFLWNRWRYDVVAVLTLLAAVLFGVVPEEAAFSGFASPAVVMVAAVLALSRALTRSGVVDRLADRLVSVAKTPARQQTALMGAATALSGFMNNVAALTLIMPVAMQAARRTGIAASRVLMPLSFATILGGLVTMVGTPPNILVANYRASTGGAPFGMFDFTPVGLAVAAAGLLFLWLAAPRLIPRYRRGSPAGEELFEVGNYLSELRVTGESGLEGARGVDVESWTEDPLQLIGIIRNDRRLIRRLRQEPLQEDDLLLVQGTPASLKEAADRHKLELLGSDTLAENLRRADTEVIEAVVTPHGRMAGATAISLRLRSRYGINLLAVAREGQQIMARVANVRLQPGDVLLLAGSSQTLATLTSTVGCLPLVSRGLVFAPRRTILPTVVFGSAVVAAATGWLPAVLSFALAVLLLVVFEILPLRELYDAVEWPVLVLLGAFIPVGQALADTGAAGLVADWVLVAAHGLGPMAIMGMVLVLTMFLSDVMNNAATAVVMAPLGADIALHMGVSPDPFLMAVAIGASCAFLTPIGHQNNVLVMGPGGYRFTDYWHLGLPLEAVIAAVAIPLIPAVWPF